MKNSAPKPSDGEIGENRNRRRFLLGTVATAGVVLEESTIGFIRRNLGGLFTAGEEGKVSKNDAQWEKTTPENVPLFKMKVEIDGMTFVSNTLDEQRFLEAHRIAKQKIGGPHWKPDKPCQVELVPEESTTALTDVNAGKIFTMSKALPHELIHYLLGVDTRSDKWPQVLGEFLAHSASPRDGYDRYDLKDLNNDSISMTDHTAASTLGRNFFYNIRNEILIKLNDVISDETRKLIAKEAIKRGKISFEELYDFMKQFGIDHEIFKKGKRGVRKHLFYGRFEDGREFFLPVIYDRQEAREAPVNGELTLHLMDGNGRNIFNVKLAVGTEVGNTDPIILDNFYNFLLSQQRDIHRDKVKSIFIPETGQTIALKSR